MTPHSFLGILAITLALPAALAAEERAPDRLAIKMSAYMLAAKSDLVVRARVPPDPRNRELTIEWVADDLSGGSHAITLDGARARATHEYAIKRMPPGSYVVTAILRLSDGTQIRRASNLTVVGAGGGEPVGGPGVRGAFGGGVRPALHP